MRKLQWIDEQVVRLIRYIDVISGPPPDANREQYQELFSICQAFSGPGSTKMHYCINLIRGGFLPAALCFLIWR